jgi:hypothetical protein
MSTVVIKSENKRVREVVEVEDCSETIPRKKGCNEVPELIEIGEHGEHVITTYVATHVPEVIDLTGEVDSENSEEEDSEEEHSEEEDSEDGDSEDGDSEVEEEFDQNLMNHTPVNQVRNYCWKKVAELDFENGSGSPRRMYKAILNGATVEEIKLMREVQFDYDKLGSMYGETSLIYQFSVVTPNPTILDCLLNTLKLSPFVYEDALNLDEPTLIYSCLNSITHPTCALLVRKAEFAHCDTANTTDTYTP